MYGPLVANGIIGPYTDLVFAFIIGILFGAILEQGGFSSGRKISAVFYARDFAVPKVMFTAMITAALGILISHSMGLLDATKIFLPPTYIWPHLVGGLLFGAGMVISGYCPGTSVVSSAIGRKDAMAAFGGMIIGVFLFSEAYPLLKGFMYSGEMGKFSLIELLSLPIGYVLLAILIFALGFFAFANFMERRFGAKEPAPVLGPWNALTGRWVVGIAIFIAVVAGISAMALIPGKASTQINGIEMYAQNTEDHNAIEAAALEKLINGGQELFFLVDVREKEDFAKGSLPGAYNIPSDNLKTIDGMGMIPDDRKVVLYDADGSLAFQALPLLRYNGKKAVAMAGGLLAWGQMKSGGKGGNFKLESPSAAPPPPPPPAATKGKGGFKDEGC